MPEETKVAPKRKTAKAKTVTPAAVTEKRVDESPKLEEPVPEPTPPVPEPTATPSAHSHEELEASVASLEARLHALKGWIEDCANIGTDPLRKNRLKKLRDI